MTADPARVAAFWAATDLAAVTAIVDVPGSLATWASEALLNDADGYYGGFHNFLLYDQGQKGLVFLPKDTDSTFDWLAVFDLVGAVDHPVFWWEARAKPAPTPGQQWVDRDVRRRPAAQVRGRDRGAARKVGRRADPGVDRRVVTADRRRRRGRPARLGHARQLQHGGRVRRARSFRRAPITCAPSSTARTETAPTWTATARAGATTAAMTTRPFILAHPRSAATASTTTATAPPTKAASSGGRAGSAPASASER